MKWYVKYEGTGEISGPMTQEEALSQAESGGCDQANGMVFHEGIFSPKFVTTQEADVVIGGLRDMRDDRVGAARVVDPDAWKKFVCQDAIDTITLLSAKKVVTGTINGGVLELDEVPEGVEVDIRDYDTDGVDEEILEEDEAGTHFQAG